MPKQIIINSCAGCGYVTRDEDNIGLIIYCEHPLNDKYFVVANYIKSKTIHPDCKLEDVEDIEDKWRTRLQKCVKDCVGVAREELEKERKELLQSTLAFYNMWIKGETKFFIPIIYNEEETQKIKNYIHQSAMVMKDSLIKAG